MNDFMSKTDWIVTGVGAVLGVFLGRILFGYSDIFAGALYGGVGGTIATVIFKLVQKIRS